MSKLDDIFSRTIEIMPELVNVDECKLQVKALMLELRKEAINDTYNGTEAIELLEKKIEAL